jgi:hypothetical protein
MNQEGPPTGADARVHADNRGAAHRLLTRAGGTLPGIVVIGTLDTKAGPLDLHRPHG